ncbi:hypothetical protein PTI45_02387 [Paenibacillus nuruki]|uniref:Gliding motility protein n=1 Tax=Paenibacillus nuruki TaxID=1886670 RepID=A0A1E3L5I8_9BACL|nr:hypothetical protein [Paenibacillus nuruki]ODP28230.1 hypothetical protein PTI45_02387 [Paenibacillus nuruki]
MLPQVGDIYCVFSQKLQQYVACQVTHLKEGSSPKESPLAAILELDWTGDTLPDEDTLHTMKPLVCNFYFWSNRFDHNYVSANVPPEYSFVGNIPPLVDQEVTSYAGGWYIGNSIHNQRRWERIDVTKRNLFKSASPDIEVVVGGQTLPQNTTRINDIILQKIEDFSELDKLPCLISIETEQGTLELAHYINQNPLIHELQWKSSIVTELDLRHSHLNRLMLEPDHLITIYLNDDLIHFMLNSEPSPDLHIHSVSDGRFIDLQCWNHFFQFHGLDHLAGLSLVRIQEIDINTIVERFPYLTELRVSGKPGVVHHIQNLAKLPHLQILNTDDLFGFEADEFPSPEQLPKLSALWMSSIPANVAKSVKTKYKKAATLGLDLWITKPRKPEWLAENLLNPFRDWDGREHISAANAKKAAQSYKKMLTTTRMIDASIQADTVYSLLEKMVTEYTETFNKMDRRNHIIETIEREEIYAVLEELLTELQQQLGEQGKLLVDKDGLYELFDKLRDF